MSRISTISALGRYDCVYLSPHAHDVPLSCADRLLAEAARGLGVLVVTPFDAGVGPRPADGLPVDHLFLGLPDATARAGGRAGLHAVLYEHQAEGGLLQELAARLDEVAHRTRARHVYLPLALGGHVDHRLAHEAGLRAVHPRASRDVFLYEERPTALLPGAARVRLGQIGAWLPPAAASEGRGAGRLRYLAALAQHLRGHAGALELLRCLRRAEAEWRQAQAWLPGKALGPRLQPLWSDPHAAPEAARLARVSCRESLSALCGLRDGWDPGLRAERYWLLLPPREDLLHPVGRELTG